MNSFCRIVFCLGFLVSLVSCDKEEQATEILEYDKIVPIIPDIQYYTNDDERVHYLQSIVRFCNNKKEDIEFCIQTGDVTNNNQPQQWESAYENFFSKLDGTFPTIFCLGNHDYGENGLSGTRTSNMPDKILPKTDIKMEGCRYDNYVRFVRFGGRVFAVLTLEFAPRNETLTWANSIIESLTDIPFIILTHAFLNNQGKLFDQQDSSCDNEYSQKSYAMGGDYLNDSKEIFDKVVSKNDNVKMILCGHCLYPEFIAVDYVKNSAGKEVPCIMVNYQHDTDGGRGNIGLLAYKGDDFTLYSYSTTEGNMKGRKIATIKID